MVACHGPDGVAVSAMTLVPSATAVVVNAMPRTVGTKEAPAGAVVDVTTEKLAATGLMTAASFNQSTAFAEPLPVAEIEIPPGVFMMATPGPAVSVLDCGAPPVVPTITCPSDKATPPRFPLDVSN
ncbi:hypothetical protein thsrh120_59120 [Rhizobium sp. No.120]